MVPQLKMRHQSNGTLPDQSLQPLHNDPPYNITPLLQPSKPHLTFSMAFLQKFCLLNLGFKVDNTDGNLASQSLTIFSPVLQYHLINGWWALQFHQQHQVPPSLPPLKWRGWSIYCFTWNCARNARNGSHYLAGWRVAPEGCVNSLDNCEWPW